MRVRGAPLTLARVEGHFYELFTSDDDFSYDDALLLGQRLYRRDLATGDSSAVFADTIVARIAIAYAKAHPDERPLTHDEDGEANPSTNATAEIDVLGVFGPYVSYEYHVDVALPGRVPWRLDRRGVIDLRTGRESSVADVVGAQQASRVIASARRSYESIRDSILRRRDALSGDDRRAAEALARLPFDEGSFILEDVDREPAVTFGVPARGEGAAGNLIELDPIGVDSVPSWTGVRPQLAETDTTGDTDVDRWIGAGYTVVATYDSAGEIARVSITDAAHRQWDVGMMSAPLNRVERLDAPEIADGDRRALSRAFDQAATYDENTRVASAASSRLYGAGTHGSLRAVTNTRSTDRSRVAPDKNSSRKPSRDVRAHDAAARQQHGPRVRRRDSVDDGQNRRHRRLST
jgi:hypothetical protein